MSIKTLYTADVPVVSFEIFPPRKEDEADSLYISLGRLAALSPDYISVTCGAGGLGNSNKTVEMAAFIQREHNIPSLAHMTCIGLNREQIRPALDEMKKAGVNNVLALRGDLPDGETNTGENRLRFAEDLIREVRDCGDFCIAAACYPEGHIDCDDAALDIERLKRKQEAGADFLISQLFFDNGAFFRFMEEAQKAGVTLPISAGVMPIMSRSQIERMIFMCGASLPSEIIKLLHKYENDADGLLKAGVEHAALQIEALLNGGVSGVHIYTMNKPEIAKSIMKHIGRVSDNV